MSSTTLVTFLVQTPKRTNTVRLVGSWDNFSKPYPMKKDVNLGSGHWRGCHSFTDIICDGESVNGADGARNGALMMGGRYWYYYQNDDDLEFHNPAEPSTTACPFLPGQQVNVLEVPIQVSTVLDVDQRVPTSTASSSPFTLDPDAKYRVPVPPTEECKERPKSRHLQTILSKVQRQFIPRSTPTYNGLPDRGSASRRSQTSPYPVPAATFAETSRAKADDGAHSSLPNTSGKTLRRWRSVVSRVPSFKSSKMEYSTMPLPPMSRPRTATERMKRASNDAQVVNYATSYGDNAMKTAYAGTLYDIPEPARAPPPPPPPPPPVVHSVTELSNNNLTTSTAAPTQFGPTESWLLLADDEACTADLPKEFSNAEGAVQEAISSPSLSDCNDNERPSQNQPTTEVELEAPISNDVGEQQHCDLHYSNSIASSRTSGAFSSVVDTATVFTGSRSPWRLSQPLTPTLSSFVDLSFGQTSTETIIASEENDNDRYFPDDGFHGYSLPEAEHASALTITNLETANSMSSHGDERVAFEPKHRQQIIDAWNDGAEHHKTSMQELVDDLGYLGKMIA